MLKHGLIGILSILLLTGCRGSGAYPPASAFTKNKAVNRAQIALKEYANQYQVPISEFKGPYLREGLGP